MPACGPRRGSTSGPIRPIFTSKHSRPSRGAKPREADDARPPRGRPHQPDSRGAERSRQATPREVSVTQAMTTGARRAPARSVLVSSLVLKGQAQAGSPEASGKGFHIGATRPRPPQRQDGGHRGAHDSVTTTAFGSRRPPFVRITCTSCPLSKLAIVGSLPAQYLGRGQGLYK